MCIMFIKRYIAFLSSDHYRIFSQQNSIPRAWCKTIVTSNIKWGSYNSFAPSCRYIIQHTLHCIPAECGSGFCHRGREHPCWRAPSPPRQQAAPVQWVQSWPYMWPCGCHVVAMWWPRYGHMPNSNAYHIAS